MRYDISKADSRRNKRKLYIPCFKENSDLGETFTNESKQRAQLNQESSSCLWSFSIIADCDIFLTSQLQYKEMKLREKKETNMPFSVAVEMNAGSSKAQAACSGSQQLPQQKPRKTPRLPGFPNCTWCGYICLLERFSDNIYLEFWSRLSGHNRAGRLTARNPPGEGWVRAPGCRGQQGYRSLSLGLRWWTARSKIGMLGMEQCSKQR